MVKVVTAAPAGSTGPATTDNAATTATTPTAYRRVRVTRRRIRVMVLASLLVGDTPSKISPEVDRRAGRPGLSP